MQEVPYRFLAKFCRLIGDERQDAGLLLARAGGLVFDHQWDPAQAHARRHGLLLHSRQPHTAAPCRRMTYMMMRTCSGGMIVRSRRHRCLVLFTCLFAVFLCADCFPTLPFELHRWTHTSLTSRTQTTTCFRYLRHKFEWPEHNASLTPHVNLLSEAECNHVAEHIVRF